MKIIFTDGNYEFRILFIFLELMVSRLLVLLKGVPSIKGTPFNNYLFNYSSIYNARA